jgi:hypothetical protein
VSTRNRISRAPAAFVLVLAAAGPLAAQQPFAAPVALSGEIVAQPTEREKQVVPSDTANEFTKKSSALAVAFGYLIPGGGQIYSEKYGKGKARTADRRRTHARPTCGPSRFGARAPLLIDRWQRGRTEETSFRRDRVVVTLGGRCRRVRLPRTTRASALGRGSIPRRPPRANVRIHRRIAARMHSRSRVVVVTIQPAKSCG